MHLDKNKIISILFLICFSNQAFASDSCEYEKPSSCNKNEVCVLVSKRKSECRKNYSKPLIKVIFPFKQGVEVSCDQGNLSPKGNSHTWWNTAYALDLTTKFISRKGLEVIAGAAGRIISHSSCITHNDQCGGGFGNHVKILTDKGFVLFYAHLEKVRVSTGQTIEAGQVIGTEGNTGWTGKDNRHLHFSVHYDWRSSGFEYWKGMGYLPASIPFKLRVCDYK